MRRLAARLWRVEPAWPISLGFAAAMFSGHWDKLGVPIALDRVLLFGGFALVVLRAGSSRDLPPLRFRPIHLALLAVVCYGFVSAVWVGTLSVHESRFALIDRLGLVPFVAFLIAPTAFATHAQRMIFVRVLVVMGAYLGVTAIFESFRASHALVWPSYILDPEYGIHRSRARGPFVQAAADGIAMVACATAAAIALNWWTSRSARLLCWATMGLCAAGIVLTYTRQVWLAAAFGLFATLAVFPSLRWRFVPVLVTTLAAIATGLTLVPGLQDRIEGRLNDQLPVWTRQSTNAAALLMIAERPVTGWGWGRFRENAPDHYRTIEDIRYTGIGEEVHNVFLSRFSELGLLGGGLWLIATMLALGGALVRPQRGDLELFRMGYSVILGAVFVSAMLVPLAQVMPTLVVWMWAGMLMAGRAEDERAARAAA